MSRLTFTLATRLGRSLALWLGGAATLLAASCSKEDTPEAGAHLYQQYSLQADEYGMTAGANLRRGGVSGECVRLTGKSDILVNGARMDFVPVSPDDDHYTYTAQLSAETQSVEFTLKVDDSHSIVNTADMGWVPAVTPDLGEDATVQSGLPIPLALNGVEPYDVSATVTSQLPLGPEAWSCSVSSQGKLIVTPALTPGRYVLKLTSRKILPTQQNDAPASGSMSLSRSHTTVIKVI